jgi:hypothetical protein
MYTSMAGPPEMAKNDIQLFTLSKLSGHASARVGWAFVGTKNSNFRFEFQSKVGTLLYFLYHATM